MMPPGRGPYGPQGHVWQDLSRGPLDIVTHNMKALGLVVSEKKIFICFSHCKSMGAIRCHGNQSSDPTWPKA